MVPDIDIQHDAPRELTSPGSGVRGMGQRRVLPPAVEQTPYGIALVQADQLTDITISKKICIIDSGYASTHDDLPPASGTNMSLVDTNNNTVTFQWNTDGHGHGTHVAGVIAAISGNGKGSAGVVGQNANYLHIVRILDDSNEFVIRSSDVVNALDKCKDADADIINMSLQSNTRVTAEETKCQQLADDGILLVASAGNNGDALQNRDPSSVFPASYSSTLSVGAVDQYERYAKQNTLDTFCGGSSAVGFTSQNNCDVDIVAPGVGVNSINKDGGISCMDGTSQAAPHVAGVAALIWSKHPNCGRQDIIDAIKNTAKEITGDIDQVGSGLLQGKAALDELATKSCATTS